MTTYLYRSIPLCDKHVLPRQSEEVPEKSDVVFQGQMVEKYNLVV
jgi:hypothetical protein